MHSEAWLLGSPGFPEKGGEPPNGTAIAGNSVAEELEELDELEELEELDELEELEELEELDELELLLDADDMPMKLSWLPIPENSSGGVLLREHPAPSSDDWVSCVWL